MAFDLVGFLHIIQHKILIVSTLEQDNNKLNKSDMFKKHLILALLLVMASFTASADTWKMHSIYLGSYIDNAFDTGDKVYYLNNNCLFQCPCR